MRRCTACDTCFDHAESAITSAVTPAVKSSVQPAVNVTSASKTLRDRVRVSTSALEHNHRVAEGEETIVIFNGFLIGVHNHVARRKRRHHHHQR